MMLPDYVNSIGIAIFVGLIIGFVLRSYVHSLELIANSKIQSLNYLIFLCLWDFVERTLRYAWFFLLIGLLTIFLFIAISFPESITSGVSLTTLGPKLIGPFCLTLFIVCTLYELLVFLYVVFFAERPFKYKGQMSATKGVSRWKFWRFDSDNSLWNAELTDLVLKHSRLNLAHDFRGVNLRQYTWGIYDQRYEARGFGSFLFADELVFCGSLRKADHRLLVNTMISEVSRLTSFDWIPSIPYLIFDILNAFRGRFSQDKHRSVVSTIAYYCMFFVPFCGNILGFIEKQLTKNREIIRDAYVCQFGYWHLWYALHYFRTFGDLEFEKVFGFDFAEIDQWPAEEPNLIQKIQIKEGAINIPAYKHLGAPMNPIHNFSKEALAGVKDFFGGIFSFKPVNYSSERRLRWVAVYGLGIIQSQNLAEILLKVWRWPQILRYVIFVSVLVFCARAFKQEAPKYRLYEIPKKLQEYEKKMGIEN